MLKPGEMADISIEMTSPSETGIHQGQWRMSTAAGLYFGGKLSCNHFVTADMHRTFVRSKVFKNITTCKYSVVMFLVVCVCVSVCSGSKL